MSVLLKERDDKLLKELNESKITYSKLNIDNKEEVIKFEKALYNEFMERNPDTWVSQSYIKTADRRFVIPMNYIDLGIYIAKKEKIIMGFGFNFNNNDVWQAEKAGFRNITKDDETLEGLFFFSVQRELIGLNFFDISNNLFIMAKNDFVEHRPIKKVIFTCTKQLLNMYYLMECNVIQKIIMKNGEEKYLLCFFI